MTNPIAEEFIRRVRERADIAREHARVVEERRRGEERAMTHADAESSRREVEERYAQMLHDQEEMLKEDIELLLESDKGSSTEEDIRLVEPKGCTTHALRCIGIEAGPITFKQFRAGGRTPLEVLDEIPKEDWTLRVHVKDEHEPHRYEDLNDLINNVITNNTSAIVAMKYTDGTGHVIAITYKDGKVYWHEQAQAVDPEDLLTGQYSKHRLKVRQGDVWYSRRYKVRGNDITKEPWFQTNYRDQGVQFYEFFELRRRTPEELAEYARQQAVAAKRKQSKKTSRR